MIDKKKFFTDVIDEFCKRASEEKNSGINPELNLELAESIASNAIEVFIIAMEKYEKIKANTPDESFL